MATDYDAPRNRPDEASTDVNLGELRGLRTKESVSIGDDPDPFEAELDLPGSDVDSSDLTMTVLPKQADEFTCTSCYLVYHHSQLADPARGRCRDCAS